MTIPKIDIRPTLDSVTLVVPALAVEIGLNESILLMQIRHWIKIGNNYRDGQWWTYQSVREMQQKAFPYWSINTINRAVQSLEAQQLVTTTDRFNEKKYDKTRWFALNAVGLQRLRSVSIVTENGDALPVSNSHSPYEYDTTPSQNGTRSNQFDTRSSQNGTRSNQNETTIPESTTESTTENTTERKAAEIRTSARAKAAAAAASPLSNAPEFESGENHHFAVLETPADPAASVSPLTPLPPAPQADEAARGEVFRLYIDNIGELKPLMRDTLIDAIEEHGAETVGWAIREAVLYNKRTWSYVRSCLARYKRDGGNTGGQQQTDPQKYISGKYSYAIEH